MFKDEAVVAWICYAKPPEHTESAHIVKPVTSQIYQPAGALKEFTVCMFRHQPDAN